MSFMNDATFQHLIALEQRLHSPAIRNDANEVDKLLSVGFREFGSSGRVCTKAEIIGELGNGSAARIQSRNFACEMLAAGLALVTYVSIVDQKNEAAKSALRSSIWRFEEGTWRLIFHQGTPTSDS